MRDKKDKRLKIASLGALPSYMDKSFRMPGLGGGVGGSTLFRQCLYFGNFWTGIPSLRMNNNGQTLEQMLYVHVAMIMMRSIRRTTPPPMATCFFLFSHHICLCSFDATFWNCLFSCVGVIRKYVQAAIVQFMVLLWAPRAPLGSPGSPGLPGLPGLPTPSIYAGLLR